MDVSQARELMKLTSDFYQNCSASFSATRARPWEGWERVLDIMQSLRADKKHESLHILDIACGNLRFERFLVERRAQLTTQPPIEVCAVDNCANLVAEHPVLDQQQVKLHFEQLDVAELLLDEGQLNRQLTQRDCPAYDVAVSFAFMHHLPLLSQRRELIASMLSMVQELGLVVLSFWQFAHDEKLLSKAAEATKKVCSKRAWDFLGEHDYLLGWQNQDHQYRYCHHFEDSEIDELLNQQSCLTHELARFSADGKSGTLNRYVVLQKCSHQ
ncbi:MAG: class I SAM-dependent methyltransferase [Atopobiaceae bacterium]|nr:class I SAM-dependent methyltransferase [Atopobiaceae bacterium]